MFGGVLVVFTYGDDELHADSRLIVSQIFDPFVSTQDLNAVD
jgi:hypothetical protein